MRTGAALMLGLACVPAMAQTLSVEFTGSFPLGNRAVDQAQREFIVGGISGIVYLTETVYLAVMDNSDRLVYVYVGLDAQGVPFNAAVTGGFTLPVSMDFEGIAATGLWGTVFLAEEDTPGVRMFDLVTAAPVGSLSVPAVFASRRANFGFESLTRAPDGSEMWTANEEALAVDGPVSSPTNGTSVRLLRYAWNGAAYTPAAQYAYLTAPMHAGAISGGRSGLVDLVLLPDGRLLALERSLANNVFRFFETRIYEVSFAGATEVSGLASLTQPHTPVTKRLLYQGGHTNLEGLCLGPRLADGSYALVGVVDDGDPLSTNRVVAFRISGVNTPPPACPADFNGDGFVDFFDADAFVACFEGDECPPGRSADFNGDGFVDFFDLDAYVGSFEEGC
ncbi:MAG: esterase-like activity of phytase family protein [Phycisphaeraceae bacterium]|nr:MAG: esterase-like activity of phytase family protein [Phycisphaeraceae bacterium]